MTIRQVLLGATSSAAGISFRSSGIATGTTMTLPTHESGDMIVVMAYGPIADGYISAPDGWTVIQSYYDDPTFAQAVVARKVATSSEEESGTWTNALYLQAGVWDGVGSIGGSAKQKSSGSTVYWPAVTMSNSDGSSWVAGMLYATGSTTGLSTSPTGMTNRRSGTNSALHDTADGVASWSQQTTTMGSSGNRYVFTFELVAE